MWADYGIDVENYTTLVCPVKMLNLLKKSMCECSMNFLMILDFTQTICGHDADGGRRFYKKISRGDTNVTHARFGRTGKNRESRATSPNPLASRQRLLRSLGSCTYIFVVIPEAKRLAADITTLLVRTVIFILNEF